MGRLLVLVKADSEPISITAQLIPFRKNGKAMVIQTTPKVLNIRWALAARLADTFAIVAAKFAVIVVPIFSPRTRAAAVSNPIQPLLAITSVSAMVAEEDWMITVSRVPIKRKIKNEPKPRSV